MTGRAQHLVRVVERLHGRPVDPERARAGDARLADRLAARDADRLPRGRRAAVGLLPPHHARLARRRVLVTPTLTRLPAPSRRLRSQAGVTDDAVRFSALVRIWNVTGQPAISLPLARDRRGHPGRRPAGRAARPRRPAARPRRAARGGRRLARLARPSRPRHHHAKRDRKDNARIDLPFARRPRRPPRRYDAMLAEVPTENMIPHLCLRAADGSSIVDTCPTKEVFEAFYAGEPFRSARQARAARAGQARGLPRAHRHRARRDRRRERRLISARGCAR